MKTRFKNSVNRFGLTFLVLAAVLFWIAGCATHSDPLAGWQIEFKQIDSSIEKDYQDYIQNLPSKQRSAASVNYVYKDGTGQHAVDIEVSLNRKEWRHILIYDMNNKRTKVIKYFKGFYGD